MRSAILALLLTHPFTSFQGTGSAGTGDMPRPHTVACYGDSITEGAGASPPYPAQLDGLLPGGTEQGYFVTNEGIAGETAHQIYTRVVSNSNGVGASTCCLGTSCGVYVVQGLVNTLKSADYAEVDAATVASYALDGASSANSGTCNTAVANDCGLLDSVDYLHATYPRAKIFAMGVTPYKGCNFATCGTLVEPGERAAAANAGLLAACATRKWLTCIITYDALEDPNNADNLDPAYDSGDGIHPNATGAGINAQAVFDSANW